MLSNPHQEWPKHFNPAVDTKRAVLNAKREALNAKGVALNTKRAALNTARAALDDQSGPGAKRERASSIGGFPCLPLREVK